MKIKKFEELEIWKISIDVAKEIYKVSAVTKFAKDFGFRDQIRRSSVSISSNIAEGFEIHNNNDFIKYLRIAKGSVGETRSQLYLALELDYIRNDEFNSINERLLLLSGKIGKLIEYMYDKKNNKEFLAR